MVRACGLCQRRRTTQLRPIILSGKVYHLEVCSSCWELERPKTEAEKVEAERKEERRAERQAESDMREVWSPRPFGY